MGKIKLPVNTLNEEEVPSKNSLPKALDFKLLALKFEADKMSLNELWKMKNTD